MLVYQRVILRNAIVVINRGLLGFTKSGISGMIQLKWPQVEVGYWLLVAGDSWTGFTTRLLAPSCDLHCNPMHLLDKEPLSVFSWCDGCFKLQIISIKFLSEPQYRRSFFQNNRVWVFSGAHDFQGWPGLATATVQRQRAVSRHGIGIWIVVASIVSSVSHEALIPASQGRSRKDRIRLNPSGTAQGEASSRPDYPQCPLVGLRHSMGKPREI